MTTGDPVVLHVIGSDVGHLFRWAAGTIEPLCGAPNVILALERQQLDHGTLDYTAGLRPCRRCLYALDQQRAADEERIEAMGGRPDDWPPDAR